MIKKMTANTDITALSLAEVSARIHAREVSCQEVTRAQLERIGRLEPTVNGYVAVHMERAMAQALAADALLAAGVDHGPLHGVPIAVKDLFAERGIPSSAGSSILADWVPDDDATAVHKLRQAGAIIIGRANMDEFAFGGTTENTHYGVTPQPVGPEAQFRRLKTAAPARWSPRGSHTPPLGRTPPPPSATLLISTASPVSSPRLAA